MTLQQKRRAMAEACPGIFSIYEGASQPFDIYWKDGPPVTEREWLYAVHLAEGTLDANQQERYMEYLHACQAVEWAKEPLKTTERYEWYISHATESQRIDAFLKVKGLWRE